MARSGPKRADSGSSRTWLIHASSTACGRYTDVAPVSVSRFHRPAWETEFCGQRLAGEFRRRARENGRNSVRRPSRGSLTSWNCEGFYRPGNRVGLPGLELRGFEPLTSAVQATQRPSILLLSLALVSYIWDARDRTQTDLPLLAARSIASLGRVQIGSKASHPFSPSDMHGQRLTALALGLAACHSRYMPHDALASI
jgi:hypothetical protein